MLNIVFKYKFFKVNLKTIPTNVTMIYLLIFFFFKKLNLSFTYKISKPFFKKKILIKAPFHYKKSKQKVEAGSFFFYFFFKNKVFFKNLSKPDFLIINNFIVKFLFLTNTIFELNKVSFKRVYLNKNS